MMCEESNDSTTCPVCFELYTEAGKHIPRLLPCSHTLCHSCMQTLTKNGKLECPQDRQVYHAKKRKLIFPQNQYILKQLEKKPFEGEFQICNKHKKKKNLYCKERKCQTGICSVCLTAKHRRHAVVDFLTVKENIVNDVATEAEKLSKSLADQKEKLTNLREKMTTKYNQHIDQLNDGKTDFMASVQPKLDKIEDILQSLNIQKRANLKMKCRDLLATKQAINELKIDGDLLMKVPVTFSTFEVKETQEMIHSTKVPGTKISAKKIFYLGNYRLIPSEKMMGFNIKLDLVTDLHTRTSSLKPQTASLYTISQQNVSSTHSCSR